MHAAGAGRPAAPERRGWGWLSRLLPLPLAVGVIAAAERLAGTSALGMGAGVAVVLATLAAVGLLARRFGPAG
jgi:hypothetical protein